MSLGKYGNASAGYKPTFTYGVTELGIVYLIALKGRPVAQA
jgi:hypothetical protein